MIANFKDSLKACFENVNIIVMNIYEAIGIITT